MYTSNTQISCSTLVHVENIKDFHHYTNSSVETAAAAVNAGVNLEDANLPVNVFSHLGDAIQKVSETANSDNHLLEPIRQYIRYMEVKATNDVASSSISFSYYLVGTVYSVNMYTRF